MAALLTPAVEGRVGVLGWVSSVTRLEQVEVPLAHIYGDRSVIITRGTEHSNNPLPDDTLKIAIPDSAHHVMIDQPLALVAALRSLLAVWPG